MKGFTLIETLVAITILTLSVAAPLTLASRAIVAARTANDQLTASYLAQEGIEYVRAMRDDNYLATYPGSTGSAWSNFLSAINQCRAPKSCTLGLLQAGGALPLTSCPLSTPCTPAFSLITDRTPFNRTVQITNRAPYDELITSTVTWSFHGIPYSVSVTDHLTPWQ